MDRITRKELKTDKFAEEVGHTVEFLEEHRRQAFVAAAVAVVLILAGTGVFYYMRHQRSIRQETLREALRVYDATISAESNPFFVTFKTEEEKDAAVQKALGEIAGKYSGSDEAAIASFYLGLAANNRGRSDEAEKHLKQAMDSGREPYDSQAAYSLAQLYAGLGRNEDAEKVLRQLVEEPSVLVSKEQATIALARIVGKRDPAEARRLLEPLRGGRSAVSRSALTALGELPQQPAAQP